jgi:predicted methyltransferase
MSYRRFLLSFFRGLLPVLLLVGAGWAQQTEIPPRTQDRPLSDRIRSQERPERDQYLKPDEVIKALNLKNGEVVADIGAGTGYFTRRFARAVAPSGKVYAVDIAADVIDYQKQRAKQENLNNIVFVVSRPADPLLAADSVDLAFFCDVIHHLENRVGYYKTLIKDIKPHGYMAIIDYPPDSPRRPHPANQLVPREEAISEAEQAGFKFVKDFPILPDYYFLLFAKR